MFGIHLQQKLHVAFDNKNENLNQILYKSWKRFLGKFLRSERGHVGVMFGIFLLPIVSAVGMSVDYSSAISAKAKIQAALDAAALAAGRMLQTSGSTAQAQAAAQTHFSSTIDSSIKAKLKIHSIDSSTGKISMSGSADVPTKFMGIIGIKSIAVSSTTHAELAIGGEGDKVVEVSMMLDVTGSMQGSKLKDMKVAAKDLVQILLQSSGITENKTRIALVPFSESVNVRKYAEEAANAASATTVFKDQKGKSKKWYVAKDCITERTGKHAFTDAAPKGQDKVGRMYTSNGKCLPSTDLVPLTDDKSLLDNAIDSFYASGYTAGHLGTAWAWYTLSPNWKTVWPKKSRPNDYNTEETQKIAILMTDGDYNTEYYNGVMTRHQKSGTKSPNGDSDTQADKLCENMKAAGIVVYTVGFELKSKKAKNTMKNCATSDDHYFLAEDGEKLKQVFREIAFQIAQLRLTK